MHLYGGLYLDLDMECFQAADDSIGNYSIVLQGTGAEGVTNAVMASTPKSNLWIDILHTCKERANAEDPIFATGPAAVVDTIQQKYNVDARSTLGFSGGLIEVRGEYTCVQYAHAISCTHACSNISPCQRPSTCISFLLQRCRASLAYDCMISCQTLQIAYTIFLCTQTAFYAIFDQAYE